MEVVCIIVTVFNVLQAYTPFQPTALPTRERRPLKKRRTTADEADEQVLQDGQEEEVSQQQQPSYQVGM